MTVTIHHGDCREIIATLPDCSIDAIVTDPPYELTGKSGKGGFMGKAWDATGIAYDVTLWAECLRVLKPGGHLLAFGGTRTYHRMTVAIEDAGFEIRDSIHWLYGSGFPKSLDVSKAIDKAAGAERDRVPFSGGIAPGSHNYGGGGCGVPLGGSKQSDNPATDAARQWQGWGTALKPAHEPIVVARKPLAGTVAANVLEHGTGALNIDGCRVACIDKTKFPVGVVSKSGSVFGGGDGLYGDRPRGDDPNRSGRWPANLVLTHAAGCGADECAPSCAVAALDSQSGNRKSGIAVTRNGGGRKIFNAPSNGEVVPDSGYTDSGGASRFFTVTEWDDLTPFLYTTKASRRERNAGLDGLPERTAAERYKTISTLNAEHQQRLPAQNHHPTVKPLALMRWLVRLVTPPGGTVLEPFAGSGTTLAACVLEGFNAIGCEMTDDYLPIIEGRVAWAQQQTKQNQESLFNQ